MKTAIELIQEERARQITKGLDASHDDTHDFGELAAAAATYAAPEKVRAVVVTVNSPVLHGRSRLGEVLWPFEKPLRTGQPRIQELVKSGALIVAEIERLQRAEAKGGR